MERVCPGGGRPWRPAAQVPAAAQGLRVCGKEERGPYDPSCLTAIGLGGSLDFPKVASVTSLSPKCIFSVAFPSLHVASNTMGLLPGCPGRQSSEAL